MHICCTDMYYGHSSAVVAPITCRTPENYGKPCHKGKIHLLNLPCFGKILCSRQVAVWKYMRYKLQYPIGPRSQNEMMVLCCSGLLFNGEVTRPPGQFPMKTSLKPQKNTSYIQVPHSQKNIFRQKTPKNSVTKKKQSINAFQTVSLCFFNQIRPNASTLKSGEGSCNSPRAKDGFKRFAASMEESAPGPRER